jgi:hypothetical protein
MAKYKITAPERSYTGSISGVQFRDGVAQIDDIHPTSAAVLNYCRGAGYTVEEVDETTGETGEESTPKQDKEPEASFDPAKHDAKLVLAYLADADAAEAERVLDAEAAGKARKGILDQREQILARARDNAETAPKENDQ